MLLRALLLLASAGTPEPSERIRTLEGNAFLVEEAYNLEEHRVGQAATFARSRGGDFTATAGQDWPLFSERHQIGWAQPLARQGTVAGAGDAVLNYRYQLLGDEDPVTAAPHLAVSLPTGDARRGLGAGGVGLSLNVPFSVRVSGALALHANVGAGVLPSGRRPGGAATSAWSVLAGQSVALAVHENLHLLAEVLWTRAEIRAAGAGERVDTLLLSPGVRAGGGWGPAKVAVGVAAPWDAIGHALTVVGFVAVELPFGEAGSTAPSPPPHLRAGEQPEEPGLVARQ